MCRGVNSSSADKDIKQPEVSVRYDSGVTFWTESCDKIWEKVCIISCFVSSRTLNSARSFSPRVQHVPSLTGLSWCCPRQFVRSMSSYLLCVVVALAWR